MGINWAEGFIPVSLEIAKKHGTNTALVYGRVWFRCNGERGYCDESVEHIAGELGISRNTAKKSLVTLCEDGYIADLTPLSKRAPHRYADLGKVRLKVVMESSSQNLTPQKMEADPSKTEGLTPQKMEADPSKTEGKENIKKSKKLKNDGAAKKPAATSDPFLHHPHVVAFRSATHRTPDENNRRLLSEASINLSTFEADCLHWGSHGWNKGNVRGMINFHANGGAATCSSCRKPGAPTEHKPPARPVTYIEEPQ